MTTARAKMIAADRGWTLLKAHGAWHVLSGSLPIAAGSTITAAVEAAVDMGPL